MPRDLPSLMIAPITSNAVSPCYLLDIQLVSGTEHVWNGVGTVSWNGNSYKGVGSFGAVSDIQEGSEVKADGTSVSLSGIDPTLLNETLNDIQVSAPATVWMGVFSEGAILTAYKIFGGTVDKPQVGIGVDAIAITLALETKLANLQRANNRRYTAADQRRYYTDDSGFNWVEQQNDIAEIWG
jgi:hypothetical protein